MKMMLAENIRAFRKERSLTQEQLSAPLGQLLAEPDAEAVETVCAAVLDAVRKQGLSGAPGEDLERHAYTVNDTISDPELRNLHILAGV